MRQARVGRRGIMVGGTALAAASIIRPREARAAKPVIAVWESEAVILDPYATTATITRSFASHVYDTLFGMNEKGEIKPQMLEGYSTSSDKLTWNFTLRGGLKWHDGAPVTSEDCVASLNRWMPKDPLGRMLKAVTASLATTGGDSFRLVLKAPFPMLLQVLGKPNAPLPVILPAKVVAEAGDGRIKGAIGSGPFRFRPDLWKTGASMILERNPDYVPRAEPADFLAGGKKVMIDQLDLRVMPDANTGSIALIAGEIDYMQFLPFDTLELLEKAKGTRIFGAMGIHMYQGNFRLNHAFPPFDNPKVRQVMWKLVDQASMLEAIGIPPKYRLERCNSFWMCDAPYSSDAGAEVARFDVAAAKAELAASGYKGEKVIVMDIAGSIAETASRVLQQSMKQAGFNVETQSMDWGTVLARRAKKEGWSMFPVYSNGTDMLNPLTHFYVASTCADYPGWSCDPRIPVLLAQFTKAEGLEAQRKLAAEIQKLSYELTPSVMWGQFTRPAGYRTTLKNFIESSYPMFWQVEKA
ncbi:MAG: ABC transporter substrate-binding protein [Acetobacteraceae bacterium]|nr:ABC transporter substrate-binding protein [Acetobacteraceae bacterium]